MNDTKFEEDLKQFFPHIYDLHQLGKSETNLWDLVDVIMEMRNKDITGRIYVTYTKGHIDSIQKQEDLLAYKKIGKN